MICICLLGFPGGSVVKNLPANSGDVSSIPGLDNHLKEGIQYSCLGKSMAHGAWGATIYRVKKELGMTKQLNNSNNNKLFIASVQVDRSVVSDSLRPHGLQHRYRNTVVLWACDFAKSIIFRKFKKCTPWDFLRVQPYYLSIGAIFFLSFPYLCGFKFFLFLLS